MSNRIKINIGFDELAWFESSPDAGDINRICSYCGFVISKDDDSCRFCRPSDNKEVRLPMECFQLLLK